MRYKWCDVLNLVVEVHFKCNINDKWFMVKRLNRIHWATHFYKILENGVATKFQWNCYWVYLKPKFSNIERCLYNTHTIFYQSNQKNLNRSFIKNNWPFMPLDGLNMTIQICVLYNNSIVRVFSTNRALKHKTNSKAKL